VRHGREIFLLGGWVLMHPPLERDSSMTGGYRVDLLAPFPSGWTHYMSFDTAKECEQARMGDIKLVTKLAREAKRTDGAFVAEDVNARCVPVDVVYPPPAPAQK
jgi:hypothetical protein